MKNLKKLLFAVLLVAAAIASLPTTAEASHHWCNACAVSGDCYSCCRCDGGTNVECILAC